MRLIQVENKINRRFPVKWKESKIRAYGSQRTLLTLHARIGRRRRLGKPAHIHQNALRLLHRTAPVPTIHYTFAWKGYILHKPGLSNKHGSMMPCTLAYYYLTYIYMIRPIYCTRMLSSIAR
jgi:hypothetical protein